MKKLWIIIGILIILVQAIPGLAADQQDPVTERYMECYSDDEKRIYFDTKTIKSTIGGDNEYIDVWFIYVYSPKGVISEIKSRAKYNLPLKGYENLSSEMAHYYFRNNQMALLHAKSFSDDGSVLDSYDCKGKYEFSDIVPDSIGEAMNTVVWLYVFTDYQRFMSNSSQESV